MFDAPPTSDELAALLLGSDSDDPYSLNPHTDRVYTCAAGKVVFWAGYYKSKTAMCESLRCPRGICSKWIVDHENNPRAWRRRFEALDLFSGMDAVYWQPFREEGSEPGAPRKDSIGKRIKDRDGRALRAVTFGGVVHYFSDVDLSKMGGRADRWPSRRLDPGEALVLFLDVILQPGVLAKMPTANRAPEWCIKVKKKLKGKAALPLDSGPRPPTCAETQLAVVDADIHAEVIAEAEGIVAAQLKRMGGVTADDAQRALNRAIAKVRGQEVGDFR